MDKNQTSEKKYFEAGRVFVTYGIEKIKNVGDGVIYPNRPHLYKPENNRDEVNCSK